VASIGEIQIPEDEDLELLQALANQAAMAITNARLFEQVSTSHKQLQTLSLRLMEVQESERKHLARELHDEIGQALTYLNLILDSMNESLYDDSVSTNKLETDIKRAHALVGEILSQVREMSLDLRPGMLDDLGILPALLAYLERLSYQDILHVDFRHSGIDRRFNQAIETTVFRVIQEALTNVTRHAQTKNVSVRVWCHSNSLGLQVKDFGIGFDTEKVLKNAHTAGLAGIKERIALCDGQITIESNPKEGTCITAEIPI
jgi:signal transduction histidine kinase